MNDEDLTSLDRPEINALFPDGIVYSGAGFTLIVKGTFEYGQDYTLFFFGLSASSTFS